MSDELRDLIDETTTALLTHYSEAALSAVTGVEPPPLPAIVISDIGLALSVLFSGQLYQKAREAAVERKNDGIVGELDRLKEGVEQTIPEFTRLLDISIMESMYTSLEDDPTATVLAVLKSLRPLTDVQKYVALASGSAMGATVLLAMARLGPPEEE